MDMTKELYEKIGLTYDEYQKIIEILGREPNELELNLFGVLWSEHCSYKNSKPILKLFPTDGPAVLQGPGENAGIVDIGDGWAVVMKVESHNHPSAVEPYQGAATGVGGIIRDIFAMGARPVAMLNSLRFGELDNARTKYLFENIVKGIGDYGNCMGIPTVAGEIYFDDHYKGNPLVNAMCVGLVRHEDIKTGSAKGTGNSVMLVGSTTGRDGMGGASFASVELTEESQERKSAVQVGDPFMEKLLLEACMDLFKTDCITGIQDLGAAGLTSSSSEMAARANAGMEIDVALVPRREKGMVPVEIMISESQERMLVTVKKGREEEVNEIFEKWGLHSVVIGKVTDDGMLTIKENGKLVGQVPARDLADKAPVYYREAVRPLYLEETENFDFDSLTVPEEMNKVFLKLMGSSSIASKEWVYKQYDYMVRTSTAVTPGSDAAVLRLRGTNKAIALTIDGNGRYCYLSPRDGGKITIAEASRNLVCSGARPLAVTDGLNFGSPMKKEIFWQFEEAVMGMTEACKLLDTPVIGGNVSFYNETETDAIYPSPIVGMVGVIEDVKNIKTQDFKEEGDVIVLLGETKNELGGSEYMKVIHETVSGKPPVIDLELESRVQKCCLESIDEGLVLSAHDCSEGGLAVAVAESCIAGNIGATVELESDMRKDSLLFGESQSRIVITVKEDSLETLEKIASRNEVRMTKIGTVGGEDFKIVVNGKEEINKTLKLINKTWREALQCEMNK